MNSIYSQEKLNEERIKELLDQAAKPGNGQDEITSPSPSAVIQSLVNRVLVAFPRLDEHRQVNQDLRQATQD